jgi:hypothetical protein
MDVWRTNALSAGLIAVMVAGSLVLWLAVPVAWLWVASQIDDSIEASMKAYLVVVVGVPLSMLFMFWLLRRLDLMHQRITGSQKRDTLPPAWRRSLSEARDPHAPTSALDVILVGTAIAALVALVVWFFAFAGSSLPQ